MKKILSFLFLAMIFIIGCSRESTPRNVLFKFLDASIHNRHEEAYGFLSAQDQEIKPFNNFKGKIPSQYDQRMEYINSKASFTIKNIAVDENQGTATATIELIVPDIEQMIKNGTFLTEKVDAPVLLEKRNEVYTLVKEKTDWKVFMNYQKKHKEMQEENAEKEKIIFKNIRAEKSYVGWQISGEIKNNAKWNIKNLYFTVYYMGKEGKPIYETPHHLFLGTSFKSGYVEPFNDNRVGIPSEWAGKITAKVDLVEFEK